MATDRPMPEGGEIPDRGVASEAAPGEPTGGGGHGEHGGHGEASDHGGHGEASDHGGHASVGFYVMIGFILAVLTGAEVGAFYMDLGSIEVPFLLVLSAAKFAIVVMFFMHLKFDSKVFTWLFAAGLVLATFMVTALVVLYHVLPGYAR